jgi:hypothetical protein
MYSCPISVSSIFEYKSAANDQFATTNTYNKNSLHHVHHFGVQGCLEGLSIVGMPGCQLPERDCFYTHPRIVCTRSSERLPKQHGNATGRLKKCNLSFDCNENVCDHVHREASRKLSLDINLLIVRIFRLYDSKGGKNGHDGRPHDRAGCEYSRA